MIATYSIDHDVPLRILLADSNIASQAIGRKILAAAGHDVVTVSNGLRALDKIAEFHPNLVLLDVYLAGCSGIEIYQQMRATPEMAHIAVLLTVGKMELFRAQQSITDKAEGLVVKPFEAAYLIPVVAKIAERMRRLEPSPLHTSRSQAPWQPPSKWYQLLVHEQRLPAPSSSHLQAQEICDVCGCINENGATVCRQCDVPLRSSVMAFRRAQ